MCCLASCKSKVAIGCSDAVKRRVLPLIAVISVSVGGCLQLLLSIITGTAYGWRHKNAPSFPQLTLHVGLYSKAIGNSRSGSEFPGIGPVSIPGREFPGILQVLVCQKFLYKILTKYSNVCLLMFDYFLSRVSVVSCWRTILI